MQHPDEAPAQTSLSPRVALASILGFWLFYFAIVSIRSAVLDQGDQWEMLGRRTVVALVSAGATLLLYLVLRRIPRRSLGLSIAIAAVLAMPAAILYSTVNWLAFNAVDVRIAAAKAGRTTKVVVIEGPRRTIVSSTENSTIMQREDGATAPAVPDGNSAVPPVPPFPPVAPNVARRVMVQVGEGVDDHDMSPVAAIAENAANGYFFIAAWAALYLALCYAAEVRVAERSAARFRAAAQAAEIRALRYQVNPHFLFNTLNSLSSLVLTGKSAEAERMIINLSTFFRTSLTGDPTEDMRLDEEIRLQRLYLDIETVRFPERLVALIDIPEALASACVPGLILQPLVENAVKYGVSRARRPVTIRIRAREVDGMLRLTVEDDGDPLPADHQSGTGVGLRNVRERMAARYGDAASCAWGTLPNGGFGVTLTLPIVRNDC